MGIPKKVTGVAIKVTKKLTGKMRQFCVNLLKLAHSKWSTWKGKKKPDDWGKSGRWEERIQNKQKLTLFTGEGNTLNYKFTFSQSLKYSLWAVYIRIMGWRVDRVWTWEIWQISLENKSKVSGEKLVVHICTVKIYKQWATKSDNNKCILWSLYRVKKLLIWDIPFELIKIHVHYLM